MSKVKIEINHEGYPMPTESGVEDYIRIEIQVLEETLNALDGEKSRVMALRDKLRSILNSGTREHNPTTGLNMHSRVR